MHRVITGSIAALFLGALTLASLAQYHGGRHPLALKLAPMQTSIATEQVLAPAPGPMFLPGETQDHSNILGPEVYTGTAPPTYTIGFALATSITVEYFVYQIPGLTTANAYLKCDTVSMHDGIPKVLMRAIKVDPKTLQMQIYFDRPEQGYCTVRTR